MTKIIKRDCTEVDFDKSKIFNAILKAMKNGSGIVKPKIAEDIANEIEEKNPELLAYIQQNLPEAEESRIDHVDLKKMSAQCKFAIRTGEFTPYPNIILRAGVAFPA